MAVKIGCTPETLRHWVRHSEKDHGQAVGLTTDERELKRANEILKAASAYFAKAEFDRHNRGTWGVEPIRENLPITPSTYHAAVACQKDPSKLFARLRRIWSNGTSTLNARTSCGRLADFTYVAT